jgi:hypothetical protein
MHAGGLKKTLGHKTKETDIYLWKQYSQEYQNKRTGKWNRPFRWPMHYRCDCHAQVKLITGQEYIRLEFCGTHDEQSHANISEERRARRVHTSAHCAYLHTGCTPAEGLPWTENRCLSVSLVDFLGNTNTQLRS